MPQAVLDPDIVRCNLSAVLVDVRRLRAAYLFGSVARGESHQGSDLDVGLLFDGNVDLDVLVELGGRLEDLVGRVVDVVDLGSASPFLALDIIRGERVLCRDPLACDEFELYVLRRAGDLAHFERERRKALLEVHP